MMRLTFADKSLLVGDDVADLLVEYSTALAEAGQADSVTVVAYGSDGQKVTAKFALSEGAAILAESTQTDLADPDNAAAESYLREQIRIRRSGGRVRPSAEPMPTAYDDFDL
ncbi:hypothetical protein [Agromyces humi]|uniref:hypothetical protein n=1 Tax=Agromyces humi TaxID=1766800 RepID=UPI001359F635|nr:hypothetical protein [Agromyces humi]